MTTIKYVNAKDESIIIDELTQKIKEYESIIKEYENQNKTYNKEDAQLCAKIQNVKMALLNANLKMTGKNNYNHYNYFELKDITPTIINALIKEGLSSRFYVIDNTLYLHIIDNKTGHYMQWDTPLKAPTQPTKSGDAGQYMKLSQSLHTYGRRTLWLLALEIVEAVTLEQPTQSQRAHTPQTHKPHKTDTQTTQTKQTKQTQTNNTAHTIFDKMTQDMEKQDIEINIDNTDKYLTKLLDAEKITKTEYDQVLKLLEFGAVDNDKRKNN